jgi:hypothetical protein
MTAPRLKRLLHSGRRRAPTAQATSAALPRATGSTRRRPAAPHGIYVWDVNDRLVLIRIHDVTATRPALEQLGEPEARDVSKMPGFKTQWIYAVRGLTLHVDDDTGATAFLYAYPPMTLAEFRASWLSRGRDPANPDAMTQRVLFPVRMQRASG